MSNIFAIDPISLAEIAEEKKNLNLEKENYNFIALYKTKLYSDIKLLINGQEFDIHLKILATRSNFFKAFLNNINAFTEDRIINVYDINGELISIKYIIDIIEYLYDGNMLYYDTFDETVIGHNIASFFDVPILKKEFESHIKKRIIKIYKSAIRRGYKKHQQKLFAIVPRIEETDIRKNGKIASCFKIYDGKIESCFKIYDGEKYVTEWITKTECTNINKKYREQYDILGDRLDKCDILKEKYIIMVREAINKFVNGLKELGLYDHITVSIDKNKNDYYNKKYYDKHDYDKVCGKQLKFIKNILINPEIIFQSSRCYCSGGYNCTCDCDGDDYESDDNIDDENTCIFHYNNCYCKVCNKTFQLIKVISKLHTLYNFVQVFYECYLEKKQVYDGNKVDELAIKYLLKKKKRLAQNTCDYLANIMPSYGDILKYLVKN